MASSARASAAFKKRANSVPMVEITPADYIEAHKNAYQDGVPKATGPGVLNPVIRCINKDQDGVVNAIYIDVIFQGPRHRGNLKMNTGTIQLGSGAKNPPKHREGTIPKYVGFSVAGPSRDGSKPVSAQQALFCKASALMSIEMRERVRPMTLELMRMSTDDGARRMLGDMMAQGKASKDLATGLPVQTHMKNPDPLQPNIELDAQLHRFRLPITDCIVKRSFDRGTPVDKPIAAGTLRPNGRPMTRPVPVIYSNGEARERRNLRLELESLKNSKVRESEEGKKRIIEIGQTLDSFATVLVDGAPCIPTYENIGKVVTYGSTANVIFKCDCVAAPTSGITFQYNIDKMFIETRVRDSYNDIRDGDIIDVAAGGDSMGIAENMPHASETLVADAPADPAIGSVGDDDETDIQPLARAAMPVPAVGSSYDYTALQNALAVPAAPVAEPPRVGQPRPTLRRGFRGAKT